MFGPRRLRLNKKNLNQSVVKANDRLKSINTRLETDIKARKSELKSLVAECDSRKEALEDIKTGYLKLMQDYTDNELANQKLQNDMREVLSKSKTLSKDIAPLEKSIKDLKYKEGRLVTSIALLETKKDEFQSIDVDLKAMKKEREEGQETLSLLGSEINTFEAKADSYANRMNTAKAELKQVKHDIDTSKRKAEQELEEIEDFGNKMKLTNGQEMARLDHSIADRMSELDDMDTLMKTKTYELSRVQFKINKVEEKVNDVEERIEIAVKKEEEKVGKIKGDFKDWKVVALNEVAKMKLKGKMETIDKAGLKDLLDG